jgi:CBS domain-containing protein
MSALTVADLMSTALITVHPKDTIARADLEMKLAGIRHFPVVDDRNHLVGVVSNRDILRGLGGADEVAVKEVMSTEVQTASEETTAVDAVEMMMEHKIGCLPIVADDGHLVGMVTETDFLQVAHRALSGGDLAR